MSRFLLIVSLLLLPAASLAAAEPSYPVSLAGGRLLDCLEQVTALTRVPIIDSSGLVRARHCSELRGSFTLTQLLDRLLSPAGLGWLRRRDGSIEVQFGYGEQIHLGPLNIDSTPLPDLAPASAINPPVSVLAQDAMSVTRLDQERLQDEPLLSFDQLGRYAPNVYGAGPGLAVRGQERDSDYYSGLSFSLDGIDLGSFLIDADLISVAQLGTLQIERGPRSFEHSAAAAAGAVNLYTPAPDEQPVTRVSLGWGDRGAWRSGASWSGRFAADSESGLRIAAERRGQPDLVQEQYAVQANRPRRSIDNLHAKLNWVPEQLPGLSAEIALLAVEGDDAALWAAPQSDPQALIGGRASYAQDALRRHTRALGSAARLQYGNEDWQLNARVDTLVNQRDGIWYSADYAPSGSYEPERRHGAGFSLQRRIKDWRLAIGADGQAVHHSEADVFIYDNDTRAALALRDDLDLRTDSAWFWLQRDWQRRIEIGVGLRYVRDTISASTRSAYCTAPAGLPRPDECLGDSPASPRLRNRTVTPVPLATLAWRPLPGQEFVLSHARGVRNSGGYVVYRLQQAERNDSNQAGWNATWLEQRLSTRLALFHTRVRDRYQGTADQTGARGQMRGVELELQAHLSPRWRLDLGLGRQQGDYSVYDYDNEDPDAPVAGLPLHTTLAGLHYGLPTGWYATLNYYRTSPADTSPGSSSLYRRDGYDLTDLRTGLRRADWELALIITNLFDTDYLDRVDLRSYTRLGEPRFRLGDPRRLELRWEYQWR